MANKRSTKKNFGRYLKGSVDENMALSTLGSKVLIGDTWDETVEDRARISSIVCTWALDGLTSSQGPILFGVAHSDYTDAEIEAVIENAGSWKEGSKVEQEIAKRLVRIIGTFVSQDTLDVEFNDGRVLKTKLNWILNEGDTLRMWAYNLSGTPLATTDPQLRCNGHANLWVL